MSGVEELAADERGVLLGLLAGGATGGAAQLAGPGAARCQEAHAALEASSPDVRRDVRAAAAAGEPLARVLISASKGAPSLSARSEARALVAAVPAVEAARGAVRAV